MFDKASGAVDTLLVRADAADSMADAELVRLLAEVEEVGRRVDAARVRLAGEVAHRSRRELGPERLSARLGCRTPGEAIQRVTGVAGASAGRRVRLGLATRDSQGLSGERLPARFEEVARGLRAGALGLDAAHAIVRTLEPTMRVADAASVAAGERELVAAAVERWAGRGEAGDPADEGADGSLDGDDSPDGDGSLDGDDSPDGDGSLDGDGLQDDDGPQSWARSGGAPVLDADGVLLQARVWAEFLDPDGTVPDDRDEERRFVTLHAPRRGLVPVSGLLLPQVAAALRRYADACTNPRTPDVTDPTHGAGTPTGATHGAGTRTGETQGAGAPADPTQGAPAAGPAEDAAAPVERRSRAQVLHDVLATIVGVAARVVDAPSVAGNPPTLVVVARAEDLAAGSGVAHTDDGAPMSLAVARHVGCAGAVQRIAVDAAGRIVGLWSAERCFTGAQRRAIAARDGGCVIPGCHVPVAWCEAHHVVEHATDPEGTHTDNGVLLCWHHHRTIDSSGWRIRMVDGVPWVSPPSWLDARRAWRPARARTAPHRAGPEPP